MMEFFSGVGLLKDRLKDEKMRRIFESMRKFYVELLKDFHDTLDPAGWIHDFFCDDCLEQIPFDPSGKIVCKVCGKDYGEDPKKKRAWLMNYRYNVSKAVVFGAFLYKATFDDEYIDLIGKILDFYAENFDRYPSSSRKPWEKSRLTSQSLNEAMILMNFLISVMSIDFDKKRKDYWKEKLFLPACESMMKRSFKPHNHDTWIASFCATVGLIFDEKKLLSRFVKDNSPVSVQNLVERGLTNHGFWYEGSIHYHFFFLSGVLKFYLIYLLLNGRLEKLDSLLRKALYVSMNYTFPDGRFPNPGDGWPRIGMNSYTDVLEYGAQIFRKDEDIKRSLSMCYSGKLRGEDQMVYDTSVSKGIVPEYFYFDNEHEEESPIFEDRIVFGPGESVLHRGRSWSVFLKSGQSSSVHLHEDLGNFEIYLRDHPVTVDLSNPGYGLSEYRNWFVKGLSHNTFFIDGKSYRVFGQLRIGVSSESGKILKMLIEPNIMDFLFEREISISDEYLRIVSRINTRGLRVGMSFVFLDKPEGLDALIGPCNLPNVEASEMVVWKGCTLDNDMTLNFPKYRYSVRILSSKGSRLFFGESFWIPRTETVYVLYVESISHMNVILEFTRVEV